MKLCQKFMTCWQGFGNHWQLLLYRDTIIFLPSPCCSSYHSVRKLLPWSKGPHFLSQRNQLDITHSATSTENARSTKEKSSFQLNNLHSWCWVAKFTEPFLIRLSEHVVDLHHFPRHVKAFFALWANRYAAIGISTKTANIKMAQYVWAWWTNLTDISIPSVILSANHD